MLRKKLSWGQTSLIIPLLVFIFVIIGCSNSHDTEIGVEDTGSTEAKENILIPEENPPLEKIYNFTYRQVKESSGATSWIFESEEFNLNNYNRRPPLIISNSDEFIKSVNDALSVIGLPFVSNMVPDQGKGWYVWEDYELGKLTVRRSNCNYSAGEDYDCIWKITLDDNNTY
ncbi:hypothetical protein [Synechocystis sp. CACIAM 05]|uniref:hypothetical protein n=1 Tax=Synechocystis sp. CACIAM 05 TaxID=1933929 RepID=UPI00138E82F5|nr:hypothetical protein [Synechocystis sp. CACIAM 05]QHV00263.1 hypothetical protein BWK47_09065 [Synechocystis sp. CACIAM 05]